MNRLISFVIPCFRSELTIKKVIDEIIQVVSERPEYSYEIICVNDCSPDNVYSVLRQLASDNKQIKVISFAKNQGKHAAVMAGYAFALGDFIVNLDDDCQCPVNELWKLVEPVESDECDIATARYAEKKQAGWKNIGSNINTWVSTKLLEKPKDLRMENFNVIKRFVMLEMLKYDAPFPYLEGLMLRVTKRIKTVDMEERERGDNNTTGFTLKKSLSLFSNGLTAFSVKPLRISTVAGFLAAAVGFVWAIVLIIRRMAGNIAVAGYTSSMVIQLIIGGLILMSLGLLGEYIGRMYISMNKSPQYVIKETINCEK